MIKRLNIMRRSLRLLWRNNRGKWGDDWVQWWWYCKSNWLQRSCSAVTPAVAMCPSHAYKIDILVTLPPNIILTIFSSLATRLIWEYQPACLQQQLKPRILIWFLCCICISGNEQQAWTIMCHLLAQNIVKLGSWSWSITISIQNSEKGTELMLYSKCTAHYTPNFSELLKLPNVLFPIRGRPYIT